jgi:hypothetical protein
MKIFIQKQMMSSELFGMQILFSFFSDFTGVLGVFCKGAYFENPVEIDTLGEFLKISTNFSNFEKIIKNWSKYLRNSSKFINIQ